MSIEIGTCDDGCPCTHECTLTNKIGLVAQANLSALTLITNEYWPQVLDKQHFKYMLRYLFNKDDEIKLQSMRPQCSLFLADLY